MPPKRQLPPRGAPAAPAAKLVAIEKPPVDPIPVLKTDKLLTVIPPAPVIPMDLPFTNHLMHARRLYQAKAKMIVKVQNRRLQAAKRLKRLAMKNIEAQYDFEIELAKKQSEKAISLLNVALTEYVTNTLHAVPPAPGTLIPQSNSSSTNTGGVAGAASTAAQPLMFDANSNPFQLTSAGQIPLHVGCLTSKQHKILTQSQNQSNSSGGANGNSRAAISSSRVTRGSGHTAVTSTRDTDYSSDTGSVMGGSGNTQTHGTDSGQTTPVPMLFQKNGQPIHHTHVSCASTFLTTSSNLMKRYQQLLLDTTSTNTTSNTVKDNGIAGSSGTGTASTSPVPNANNNSNASGNTSNTNTRKRTSGSAGNSGTNGVSSSMYVAASVPHFFTSNLNLAMDGATCRSDMLKIITALRGSNSSHPHSNATDAVTAVKQENGSSVTTTGTEVSGVFRRENPSLCYVRTSDKHIQVNNSVYYCGSTVNVYFAVMNELLIDCVITVITPSEIVVRAKNGVRRGIYLNQIITQRVVLSIDIGNNSTTTTTVLPINKQLYQSPVPSSVSTAGNNNSTVGI